MNLSLPLYVTSGEPAGIGVDICLDLAQRVDERPVVVLVDRDLIQQRAKQLNKHVEFIDYVGQTSPSAVGQLYIQHLRLNTTVHAGQLDVNNADYVIRQLAFAADMALQGKSVGIVTAPVQKSVINEAGLIFSGHTEFFQERAGVARVVMMLATKSLRVALVTTHLPLRQVADAITPQRLQQVIDILVHDLKTKFAITEPRILVCGLNPHAGEGGYLGDEEIKIINPVLKSYQQQGLAISDALPADTLFTPEHLQHADAILAMYHDQGLPVLKSQGFGEAINITLGLPFIRTSVDHGTALTLAGTGLAKSSSLMENFMYQINALNPKDEGHKARKRFGQNFLHDQRVIEKIVRAVNPRRDDHLVEIGPGLAALTSPLIAEVDYLNVVELDRDLAAGLPERVPYPERLNIIEADALKFDFSSLSKDKPLRIVGNLPYNISTPLLFHLVQQGANIQDMHFMLQKEVVERITAQPNTKEYGRLSVMLQYYCKANYLFEVPAGAFNPPPKVTSAVFRLEPYIEKPIQAQNEKNFAALVAHVFTQRRKTLRNSLKGKLDDAAFERANVDPMARPENLTLEQFVALSDASIESF
ncbi:hypothetical protein GWI33_011667 [Rhynchophorus ferrugineus]|uniref:Ribosomal RNA adenine methylase transferase N-terminal domain-containing protein n=1 Tax=Rhynchophorus ferrugineus TaxID=354439 RepID=A0A834MEN0_RHYFE|nr:hypothetical protein GWI33_011667 [Rhynchophorus ferrugineus]